ncbi:hypothetical protein EVJ58_g4443 [Rhodofomes roseus]|uniref:RNA-dependent RNA polymerase n=1 Tax=Rhodofomes roseus TaxID=34475 RepID=A0A4Y9YGU2_9APHY|nr:hypothetical protein EVJ58_g4443 [Rhodofomes roseus]
MSLSTVDQMLQVDTDVEVDSESLSAPSSRKPSFEFSEPSVSRLTSFTSVESNIPAVKAPATGRKRTYEYPNPDGPPSPLSPSKKRASQSESALGGTAAGCSISFPPPRLHITPQTRTRPPSPSKPSPADVSPSRRDRWMKEIQEALADTAKVGEDPSRVDVTPRATIASAAPSRGPSFRGPFRSSKDVAANTSSGARARQAGPIEPPNCSIIAHDRKVQQMMDVKRISWGVQYELARGVCSGRWQWNDVTAKKLDTLRGTDSEAAPRVESVMLDANVSRGAYAASLPLWVELDREQAALEEGTGRGLGLRGEWKGDPNWYGGKIRQIASVVESGDGFVLRLKSMMKRKSNRFARYLGSRRMLQVKLPDDKLMRKRGDDVRRFMQSKFVLCGRVFAAFAAKDGKVFLMETKEDYDRTADGSADRSRMSVEELVQWHNPLDCNSNQASTCPYAF